MIGKLLAYKGSPKGADGSWHTLGGFPDDETPSTDEHLGYLFRKMEALRETLKQDGLLIEWTPLDGGVPIKANVRFAQVEFQTSNDNWFQTIPYVITCEADELNGLITGTSEDSFSEYVSNVNEAWNLEFNETPENTTLTNTFRLTHNMSAQGKRHYLSDGTLQSQAWEEARDWVMARMGISAARIAATGTMNLPSYYQGYNHVRSENPDYAGGSFSMTEQWVLSSGNALEDFSLSVSSGIESPYVNVSIQGNIQGLETRNSDYAITTSKYDAAVAKFSTVDAQIFSRAQTYAGVSLNSIPLNKVVGRNPAAGSISYSLELDTRPTNYFANARSEVITIVETHPNDIFASHVVLGKKIGPVLQSINAQTAARREVSVELVVAPITSNDPADWMANRPNVSGLFIALRPAGTTFVDTRPETWQPRAGRYSSSVGFTF